MAQRLHLVKELAERPAATRLIEGCSASGLQSFQHVLHAAGVGELNVYMTDC